MIFLTINKFKNRYKFLSLCFISGWLISLLVSCSNSSSNLSSSQEIEFWTMQLQPKFTPYFTEINRNFEANHPEQKIRWVDVPWNAMQSKVLTAVSAKDAPDVINLNPDFASQLASRQAWLNLEQKITPETQAQYLPKIWAANQIEICPAENQCQTSTFGIPWYLTTTITIYNQKILESAGINQPPASYEDLTTLAKQVKEKTGKYAVFVTLVPNDSSEVLESLVQMGVKLVGENGKAAFNTPEGIKAFRYWVDLYQQDLLPPEIMTQGHRHGIELYQAGELAILNMGAEFLPTIANNAPTIYAESGVAPQITGTTGKKNVAVMNLVIPRDTDKPTQAVDYALFVTNAENQLQFAQQANVLPSHNQAIAKYLQNLAQEGNSDLIAQAKKISAMQLEDGEVLIPPLKNINQLKKIIYENLQGAMLKEKTVKQAVEDASRQWDNL